MKMTKVIEGIKIKIMLLEIVTAKIINSLNSILIIRFTDLSNHDLMNSIQCNKQTMIYIRIYCS